MEMVERLREKAPVSYAQAKEALEYSEGNLLDALIYLEEKGAIPQAEGTRWSGREEKESQPTAAELVVQETPEPGKKKDVYKRQIWPWWRDMRRCSPWEPSCSRPRRASEICSTIISFPRPSPSRSSCLS